MPIVSMERTKRAFWDKIWYKRLTKLQIVAIIDLGDLLSK